MSDPHPDAPPEEPAAPAPAETDPRAAKSEMVPVPRLAKGDLVTHHYEAWDGPHSQVGMVVEVLVDADAGDRATVAWLEGPSGPIPVEHLEVL